MSAFEIISENEPIRLKSRVQDASEDGRKTENCIRFMLKLIAETEGYLVCLDNENKHKYAVLLSELESRVEKFLALIQYTTISLGKLQRD